MQLHAITLVVLLSAASANAQLSSLTSSLANNIESRLTSKASGVASSFAATYTGPGAGIVSSVVQRYAMGKLQISVDYKCLKNMSQEDLETCLLALKTSSSNTPLRIAHLPFSRRLRRLQVWFRVLRALLARSRIKLRRLEWVRELVLLLLQVSGCWSDRFSEMGGYRSLRDMALN